MRLLRTAARASVATRVIGNTHRRQQQRWATQDAQAPALAAPAPAPVAPAPAASPDAGVLIAQLQQLGQLRDSGVLTDAEFQTQKDRILGNA